MLLSLSVCIWDGDELSEQHTKEPTTNPLILTELLLFVYLPPYTVYLFRTVILFLSLYSQLSVHHLT